jgi:hypothetical protein
MLSIIPSDLSYKRSLLALGLWSFAPQAGFFSKEGLWFKPPPAPFGDLDLANTPVVTEVF